MYIDKIDYGFYGILTPFVCVQVAVKVIDLEEEDDEMEEIQRVRSDSDSNPPFLKHTFKPIYTHHSDSQANL